VELSFHTGVDDTLSHTRQLLRKALRRGLSVAVVGPRQVLVPLDRYLWVADPQDFLPHQIVLGEADGSEESGRLRSPVLLVEAVTAWPHGRPPPALVVDLQAAETPPEAESTSAGSGDVDGDATVDWTGWAVTHRVQVIGVSPAAVHRGRVLWRQAQQRGLTPRHLNLAAS